MSAFLTFLECRLIDEDKGLWQLTAPLRYQSDLLGKVIEVPVGFVTDFASIPRLPIIYLAYGGKGDRAATVHDLLYTSQAVTREIADKVLAEALLVSGYDEATVQAFYEGVREFGGSHWDMPNQDQPACVNAAMAAMNAAG